MSESLYWGMVEKMKPIEEGGHELREIVREKFGNGSIVSYQDMDFLDGLIAAKVPGAFELRDLIMQHEKIKVFIK